MASEQEVSENLEGKLQFLTFIEEETRHDLQKHERKSIERQLSIYESKIDVIYVLKTNLTELKLGNGEEEAKVRVKSNKIQQDVKKYEM